MPELSKDQMTDEEKQGVEAITYLLALTNDKEPWWKSLKTWRTFNQHEKDFTLKTYLMMKEQKDGKGDEETPGQDAGEAQEIADNPGSASP